jgi:hypothetical protein
MGGSRDRPSVAVRLAGREARLFVPEGLGSHDHPRGGCATLAAAHDHRRQGEELLGEVGLAVITVELGYLVSPPSLFSTSASARRP